MTQLQQTCHSCLKKSTNLLRCSKCKSVYYCDQNCQKNDWPSHKILCSEVKNPEMKEKGQEKQTNEDSMSMFGKLEHVGTGNFSMVYKAVSKKDNITYAIKQVQKAKVQRLRKQADVFMEKHCLNRLKECQYVVKLYRTFQDQFSLYFQMQLPEKGEIWEISKSFGIISQVMFKYYASHIVKAISILHNDYQIVHRDLKPENILLNIRNQIKLIDFGTAKDLSRPDIKGSGNGAKGKKVFQHYVGTPNYMAPQCIHNKASEKVSDIYSLAGVFYFLKIGSPPFSGGSQYLVFTKSLQNKLLTPSEIFTPQLQDLISKMNEKQMDKRITINQVMNHQYFSDIDFKNLPTYEQCVQKQSNVDIYLAKCCSNLQRQYSDSHKEPLELRKKLFETKIKKQLQEISTNYNQQFQQQIQNRLKIINIQLQVLLNITDDANIGFTELYQK